MNLRPSDVPGFQVGTHEPSGVLGGICGLPRAAKNVYKGTSPLFTAKEDTELVESFVPVIASAKTNRVELEALEAVLRTQHGRACIAGLYDLKRH